MRRKRPGCREWWNTAQAYFCLMADQESQGTTFWGIFLVGRDDEFIGSVPKEVNAFL